MRLTLDIGGEGRHELAWNLNRSTIKTIGPHRGMPIPRLIQGHAFAIPLPSQSVHHLIVERTPLRRRALEEIKRVIAPAGLIILRHAIPPNLDPHRIAIKILRGKGCKRIVDRDGQYLQESIFLNC